MHRNYKQRTPGVIRQEDTRSPSSQKYQEGTATMSNVRTNRNRRWSTMTETADYLGVSPRSLRAYISQGLIPAYRLGPRMVRLNLDEVDAAFREIPTTDRIR